jgi:cell division septation protein DedD
MAAPGGFFRHPAEFEHPVAPAPADGSVDSHAYADSEAAHYDQASANEEYAGEFAETNEYGDEYEYETDPEEEPHDDGAGFKRRHTTKIVLAVLALAIVGPAAAFGFRTIFKGGVQGPPPIIRADNSPTKAMPAGAPGEAGAKPINERLGDGGSERMVRREEDPVELNRPSGGVMPGTGGPFDAVGGLPPATSAPATTAPASAMEPKRVRTVHIPAGEGVGLPERSVPPPARVTASPSRSAASQSAPAAAGGPLAITPQATANAEQPPARAASTSAAASRAGGDSGGFVVQLSAAKSEADAQASFRAMQSKYAVLSGQHSLIRRKDQGERGVFYAAQVGPYGTKEEANQVCENLKSAGGTCFVQKN